MKAYIITSIEDFEPWRAFLLRVLGELQRKHECNDPVKTLAEIERRHGNNELACKVWLVIDRVAARGMAPGEGIETAVCAVLVTDVNMDEVGARWLHLWLGWIRKGEHAAPMHFGLDAIDDVARDMNCVGITASSGRRGYDRWIAQFGFRMRTVWFEKRLAK